MRFCHLVLCFMPLRWSSGTDKHLPTTHLRLGTEKLLLFYVATLPQCFMEPQSGRICVGKWKFPVVLFNREISRNFFIKCTLFPSPNNCWIRLEKRFFPWSLHKKHDSLFTLCCKADFSQSLIKEWQMFNVLPSKNISVPTHHACLLFNLYSIHPPSLNFVEKNTQEVLECAISSKPWQSTSKSENGPKLWVLQKLQGFFQGRNYLLQVLCGKMSPVGKILFGKREQKDKQKNGTVPFFHI